MRQLFKGFSTAITGTVILSAKMNCFQSRTVANCEMSTDVKLIFEQKPKIIGEGAFGTVEQAVSFETGKPVAVKLVDKNSPRLQDEIKVLTKLMLDGNHSHIVEFHGVAAMPENSSLCGLVFELCTGGELFNSLETSGPLEESDAQKIVLQIASALAHMHDKQVCHGDVKPENILLQKPSHSESLLAALCDLGNAKFTDKTGHFKWTEDPIGTAQYSAPELFNPNNNEATKSVDVFSLGVTFYVLLSKEFPFDVCDSKSAEENYKEIMNTRLDFTSAPWKNVSQESKSLIQRMLDTDPETRISLEEILNLNWVPSTEATWISKVDLGAPGRRV